MLQRQTAQINNTNYKLPVSGQKTEKDMTKIRPIREGEGGTWFEARVTSTLGEITLSYYTFGRLNRVLCEVVGEMSYEAYCSCSIDFYECKRKSILEFEFETQDMCERKKLYSAVPDELPNLEYDEANGVISNKSKQADEKQNPIKIRAVVKAKYNGTTVRAEVTAYTTQDAKEQVAEIIKRHPDRLFEEVKYSKLIAVNDDL